MNRVLVVDVRRPPSAPTAPGLRVRGDELLDHFVDAARASGASWSEIGGALGTSKQAVRQRFAALADPPPGQPPFGLSGPAAVVLNADAAQAREIGHHDIRPEHLVLGLQLSPKSSPGKCSRNWASRPKPRASGSKGSSAPDPRGRLDPSA